MSQEQTRRVVEAIAETQRQIDREMGYMPCHRQLDRIASYEQHITKLNAMLGA